MSIRNWFILALEGFRMYKRTRKVKKEGFMRYDGNVYDICFAIIEECWDEKKGYFRVSGVSGNYPEFYIRDFGWVVKSLISLGYKQRVKRTLYYALSRYKKHGSVTTSISPHGRCFDFPTYAPDSLAFLLYSLDRLRDKGLVSEYKGFLEREIRRFERKVVDKDGLPKKRHFSSMKDYSVRKRSSYDTVMCYMVQKYSKKLGLKNEMGNHDYNKLLIDNYWNGRYFLDDLSGKDYIAGDANVLPFWSGLVKDKKMWESVSSIFKKHELDFPFPLRYTKEDNNEIDMHWLEFLARDWEKHVCWMHVGYLFIDVMMSYDKEKGEGYLGEYAKLIEKYKNHLEVFEPDGRPYWSRFCVSSDSMIWAANYLALKKR